MFTREDYMDDKCTHRQYWAQFVTAETRARVLAAFGRERLVNTEDQRHFNSIPLKEWDRIGVSMVRGTMEKHGDYLTQSGEICILKEAAKQIIENKG